MPTMIIDLVGICINNISLSPKTILQVNFSEIYNRFIFVICFNKQLSLLSDSGAENSINRE